jgi:biopolymer transport protein ExbD
MTLRVGRQSSGVISDINVTPLADIMIVLLIIQ